MVDSSFGASGTSLGPLVVTDTILSVLLIGVVATGVETATESLLITAEGDAAGFSGTVAAGVAELVPIFFCSCCCCARDCAAARAFRALAKLMAVGLMAPCCCAVGVCCCCWVEEAAAETGVVCDVTGVAVTTPRGIFAVAAVTVLPDEIGDAKTFPTTFVLMGCLAVMLVVDWTSDKSAVVLLATAELSESAGSKESEEIGAA